MKTENELRAEFEAKSLELHTIFEEAGEDIDLAKVKSFDLGKTPVEHATNVRRRNEELGVLKKELEGRVELSDSKKALAEAERFLKEGKGGGGFFPGGGDKGETKAAKPREIGQILSESKEYAAFREAGGKGTAVLELSAAEVKTLLTLGDINNPATRAPGIVPMALEERTIRDMILSGNTSNNAMTYMEETTATNNASTVAEGDAKPESALDFTERTDNVRKIATWMPATTELLADVQGIESYIRERMAFFVRRKEESQILLGDGVAPNILGLHNRTGVQTQAKGADPVPDAIFKGMVLIQTNAFADPTGVVFHPLDWQDVRLLRTADGVYIWGSPSDAGPDRIWGLPVRITSEETQNTAFIVSRPHAQVFQREGITITISTEHSDYFVKNKVAIRAESRLALAVYRPAAFCKVTGI